MRAAERESVPQHITRIGFRKDSEDTLIKRNFVSAADFSIEYRRESNGGKGSRKVD